MTMYRVFDGIFLVYNDFHMRGCYSQFTSLSSILCIDHCREGRIEHRTDNGMQDVNHQLFCGYVEEEVQLGISEEKETIVPELLMALDLAELKERHPMSLSRGQKQRVAIASAILTEKEILVFDEPTSGLDFHHMEQTAKLIRSLQGRQTTFIVTHDLELILRCCTHVMHIDHGDAVQFYPLEESNYKQLANVFLPFQ